MSRVSAVRGRPSAGGPTTPGSTARSRLEAPDHEPMDYPLTAKAQRDIAVMKGQAQFKDLTEHILYAQTALIDFAGDINKKAFYKDYELEHMRKDHERRKKGQSSQDADDDADGDEEGGSASQGGGAPTLKELEVKNQEFKSKVRAMTDRMDANIRKAIDGQEAIESLKQSLNDTASTMIANSQRYEEARSQRAAQQNEEDEEEDVTQITATNRSRAAAASTRDIPLGPAPTETLRQRMQRDQTKYQSLSLAQRYSHHNTYIDFKQRVHENQHDPEKVPPPLPNAKTWFPTEGAQPLPGQTGDVNEDDSDEDLAFLQETISTKCPLTLREFEEPVTSNKCKHSYERFAIISLIDAQPRPGGTRGRTQGPKSVACPVSGCSARLAAADLKENAALKRQIKRIQEHQRRAADLRRDEEDETQGGRQRVSLLDGSSVNGDADDADDIDQVMDDSAPRRKSQVKREPSRIPNSQPALRSTAPQIMDLDGDSDDEG